MPRIDLQNGEHLDYTLILPRGPKRPKGDAETLVVYVHGFASHQRGEKAQYFRDRFVEDGHAYLAFDQRGHGASGGTMAELTLSRSIEDLLSVIDAAGTGFRRIVLLGSSMGGQVAAWAGAKHPDRIAANFLIAPSFFFYENRLRDLGEAGMRELEVRGKIRVKNQWVDVTVGRELIEDARRYRVDDLLSLYRTPTLIFHGTADESVPYEGSFSFVQRARARPLDLVLIAGGDHRLSEQKGFLFDVMRDFMERL
jgi:pimeloyl-ACP methyl ester carboxylesterase